MPSDPSTEPRQLLTHVTLYLVIKADGFGSMLALAEALTPLSTAEARVQVIHEGVGPISDTDVLQASGSAALVIGFRVEPTREAVRMADREGVDIRLSSVLDEAVEEVRSAVEKLLAERKPMLGTAEVSDVFTLPRVGEVVGCLVTSGVLDSRSRIRVIREGRQMYEGVTASLRRFKEDVREVRQGLECAVGITRVTGLKAGDVLECHPL